MTLDAKLDTVLAAADALAMAGQWDLAAALLDCCDNDDPRVRLTRAGQAVWRDFWQGRRDADAELAAVGNAAGTATPDQRFDIDMLTLRHDYLQAVAPAGGGVRGPGDHPAARRTDLATRAAGLHRRAPTGGSRGWAAFWRGAIADNICGDPALARTCYGEALTAGESAADPHLAAEALRHLGGHARRAGDHGEARRLWERATRLWQRAGAVPGVLSQLLLLALNAADTGEPGRAIAIACEVRRWAEALSLSRLADQAGGMAEPAQQASGKDSAGAPA